MTEPELPRYLRGPDEGTVHRGLGVRVQPSPEKRAALIEMLTAAACADASESSSVTLDEAVIAAVAGGLSWPAVGGIVGMSGEDARKRWEWSVDLGELTDLYGSIDAYEAQQLARRILALLHTVNDPSSEQLEIAVAQVQRDPSGSRVLAEGSHSLAGRDDLRTARSEGRYVRR